jgi:CheY-like chemotaxis protein/signal transduction histidine kinase/HAMP domain-containing protein
VPQTFRARLLTIVAVASLAQVVLTASGIFAAVRVESQLEVIQRHYMPRVQAGPALEAQLERLSRQFQDAVAAQDLGTLDESGELKRSLLEQLSASSGALAPNELAAAQAAIDDYYTTARDVSRRLIAGEDGERLLESMSSMQSKQARATDVLRRSLTFNREELARAFASVAQAEADATRIRLVVSVSCLVAVIALSFWLIRGVLRSLRELGAGLERFGRQDFAEPIRVGSADELGALAEQANRMARSLRGLSEDRDRSDWLKGGHAALVHELRGDLPPREVANRALSVLARYVEAPAALLYYKSDAGDLNLLGEYAAVVAADSGAPHERFEFGEGLVGAAAQQEEIVVISTPPVGYLRVRSGLGESQASTIALVPLAHLGNVTGVIELAFFRPWSDTLRELLLSVRESLVIAIEVARARAALSAFLAETQRQADRLTRQEDELRSKNEKLQVQQGKLVRANEELKHQTHVLEEQHRALEQKNAELDAARRSLEQKALELTTVSAYKTQFLANMSHELRTPLNSMLLLSNLLAENERGNLDANQVQFCKTIHGAGKDLLALINQVLDLAKIESGKQQVHVQVVSLEKLCEYSRRVFEPLARDKGLEFKVELDPTLPESIATDPQRVQQIVNNLLGNAIKFTEHGSVSLRIASPSAGARVLQGELDLGRSIALSVVDTGVGIAPEHQERIFAPFEQADGSQDRRYGGTGLGLSIARELAVLLGGELQLRSAVGRGSTFTCYLPFELPAAVSAAEHSVLPPAPGLASFAVAGAPAPARLSSVSVPQLGAANEQADLLVVEDDPAFAEVLAHIIAAQGFTASIARDGNTALRLAKQCNPRGIILDIKLADIDGWTVMERLSADPATAKIPVHFVSGLKAADRGMALGAVGYLTKPASREELTRVVDSLLGGPTERACRVLIVEDDQTIIDSLSNLLRSEKIEVRRALSAQEAIHALKSEHFDCMVMDLGLPDMDGLELLESLEAQLVEVLPIVVYTGRALSRAETARLATYTEAVVLKEDAGADRVLAEIRAFARQLKAGLQPSANARAASHAPQLRLDDCTILVAEDDMRTVYAVSALLNSKGAHVIVAENGRVALDMLEEHPSVDVLLLDLMMPEMDGYEVLARIRKDARFARLPVVVLTAKAMKDERQKCLDAGANDYLPKPVEFDRLLNVLHGYAPQPQRAHA